MKQTNIRAVFMPDLNAIFMINGCLILAAEVMDPETDTSILWYILPTSGFALLLSLYFIIRQKRKK